ncbi:MAG: low specificity L-threonine aldolase [Acidiferrobacterales bacterium]|nr:low specificity L-threonine aldolase [Acidiferrobacterales bacterium]
MPNSFASDNVSIACPEVINAVVEANSGIQSSYGDDDYSRNLRERLCDIFETDLEVFPTVSGTATNALALSVLTPSYGKVYCHALSHINTDECGAPEFFSGGAKLVAMEGSNGRISAEVLSQTIYGRGNVHHAQPATVSLTQACESGTIYQLDEIQAISEVAREQGLHVHMDGARFANALASLDTSPASMTWQSGVDVLSLGGTKNGCLAAEAVVFFNTKLVADFPYLHKRSGQLLSKMRFVSAQLEAYLADDLWLRNARQANLMAARMSEGFSAIPGAELAYPTEANEVFVKLSAPILNGLTEQGYELNDEELDGSAIRFVAAWNTQASEVDALLAAARNAST